MSIAINFFEELFLHRQLIVNLSISDFKKRYSGSYFGIAWGFIQPLSTIATFWFVFQVGFRVFEMDNFPFIVWLMCGLVPWFFFSEALLGATGTFVEYSYIVKKIVFNIKILPIVKILSSVYTHIAFIAMLVVTALLNHMTPQLIWIQLLYYSFCVISFTTALSFLTSSIYVLFRDFYQMLTIALQMFMWVTPIMWDVNMLSPALQAIFKLNPIYYIVFGFRDTISLGTPFYYNIKQTVYFWIVTIIIGLVGIVVYKRLNHHFADVL